MAELYFREQTLDDVMRSVIEAIQTHGEYINPSRGGCTELTGVLLEITDPRARISRTETRGKPFSCLGELCWYLAGTNDSEFISYYLSEYKDLAEETIIFGGYGPRFFNWRETNQVANVTELLHRKPDTRKAVIQLFDATDIVEEHKDIPCTCTLQFIRRQGALNLITYMRSNDAFLGLPHDIFAFTMLQEIIARSLAVDIGVYKHVVGSLHLYDRNRVAAQRFLDEGWQSTQMSMPPMPWGDPWPSIRSLLLAETAIRHGKLLDIKQHVNLDSYWADLVRLLQVFRYSKYNDVDGILELRRMMSSSTYYPFIDKKVSDCYRRSGQHLSE